jgi:phosphoribosyl 1,2-cyclic phosphodiesterase
MDNGIKLYSSKGTFEALGLDNTFNSNCRVEVEKFKSYKIGEFTVKVFDAEHDCEEPVNFLIEHEEMGKALFVTDSYKIKYKFDNIDHYIVEANFSSELVKLKREEGKRHFTDFRILESHMSIENLALYLSNRNLANTKNIILHHLSNSNSNIDMFKGIIQTMCLNTPEIASKGDVYELSVNELQF